MASGERDRCRWRVRDHAGWRAGVLYCASADLLAGWPARGGDPRSRELVAQIRAARQADDLEAVEVACRGLVAMVGRQPRTSPAVRAAVADLARIVTSDLADPAPCLLGCEITARW